MKAKWINVMMIVCAVGLNACLNDKGDDSNAQWTKEVNQIDQYLASNPPLSTDYVLKDQYSGIRFVIHEFGNDRVPRMGETVKFSYTGKLFSNGTLFDASDYLNKIDNIPVAGLKYGVGSVLKGTSATLYVPSLHGYGDAGNATVPGKSILVYEFDLEDIIRTSAQATQFQADTMAIHKFITDNAIVDAIEHPSGMWYKIIEPGTGDNAVLYDRVSMDYKMFLLESTTALDAGTLNDTGLFDLIAALQVGISLVKEGGKIIYYIPSGLGYGPSGKGTIPANANLRFEMTLKSIDAVK